MRHRHHVPNHQSAGIDWNDVIRQIALPGVWVMLGLVGIIPGCTTSSQQTTATLEPGDQTVRLMHNQRPRSYLIHLPPQILSRRPLPVVLNFHGGGGHAAQQQAYSNLDRLADSKGFVVVYPNGTGRLTSRFLTWNAGTCCGYAAKHHIDDVGFIRLLINDLQTRLPIDTTRVYATGLSNGAMMAYRLAAEAPDLVAAIAPIAGSMAIPQLATEHAVPIMHVHSLDDPRAPYEGGPGLPFPLTRHQEHHYPVEAQLQKWIDHNQCPGDPAKAPMLHGKEGTSEAHHTAQMIAFSPCGTGADVLLWQLSGPGHVWPGGEPTPFQRFLGPATGIIQVNREMWEFFIRHSR